MTSKDCHNLMPGEPPDDQARIKALTEESKVLEDELIEVEAKNRLYTLLGERTRSALVAVRLLCPSPLHPGTSVKQLELRHLCYGTAKQLLLRHGHKTH